MSTHARIPKGWTILASQSGFETMLEAVLIVCRDGHAKARTLKAETRVNGRYMEAYMRALVHHGILTSMRGPTGGVWLAKSADEITLGDIFRVIRGLDESIARDKIERKSSNSPAIRKHLDKIIDRMLAELDAVTIEEFAQAVFPPSAYTQQEAREMSLDGWQPIVASVRNDDLPV